MSKIFTRQELQELFDIIRQGEEKLSQTSINKEDEKKDYGDYYIVSTRKLADLYDIKRIIPLPL